MPALSGWAISPCWLSYTPSPCKSLLCTYLVWMNSDTATQKLFSRWQGETTEVTYETAHWVKAEAIKFCPMTLIMGAMQSLVRRMVVEGHWPPATDCRSRTLWLTHVSWTWWVLRIYFRAWDCARLEGWPADLNLHEPGGEQCWEGCVQGTFKESTLRVKEGKKWLSERVRTHWRGTGRKAGQGVSAETTKGCMGKDTPWIWVCSLGRSLARSGGSECGWSWSLHRGVLSLHE